MHTRRTASVPKGRSRPGWLQKASALVVLIGFYLASVMTMGWDAPSALAMSAGIIQPFAGGPGQGVATTLGQTPGAVVVQGHYVYVTDYMWSVVRRIDLTTGMETVVAGNGLTNNGGGGTPPGNGLPATQVSLGFLGGLAVDAAGNVYISDDGANVVWVVAAKNETLFGQSMTAGHLYIVAGNGSAGYTGNNGLATQASLNSPGGLTVDAAGNLYIADANNNVVRVVAAASGETLFGGLVTHTTAGDIYTVAGNGQSGYSGDTHAATSATLSSPNAVAVDSAGNLYISDSGNNAVRVVAAGNGESLAGGIVPSTTAGDIYTIAGSGTLGDGNPANQASLSDPSAVAVDSAGNLYIADYYNQRVRVVAAGNNETLAGGAVTGTTAGDIYTVAGTGTGGYTGDGSAAIGAEISTPSGVAVDGNGNVFIADEGNNRVRMVAGLNGESLMPQGASTTAGDIYTIGGDGVSQYSTAPASAGSAQIDHPHSMIMDAAGNLFVSNPRDNRVQVIAGKNETLFGIAMTTGNVYTVAGTGGGGYSGDGGPATSAQLNYPDGLALDAAGNLYIADAGNNVVRVVAAQSGETLFGGLITGTTVGDIYTVAGTGTSGSTGNGGKATSAQLNQPYGVAVDGSGNLYIADTVNNEVRVVAAQSGESLLGGIVPHTTAGDIYRAAGSGTQGASGNDVSAIAGSVQFYYPYVVAVDGAGNLYISDTNNGDVRVVAAKNETLFGQSMTAGNIYVVAGTLPVGFPGGGGYSGDGGPATSAQLNHPGGLSLDATGNLYIADSNNNVVRVVAAKGGETLPGVPSTGTTLGDIYTMAGDGAAGDGGDGGPATSAQLNGPYGLAMDTAGNLYIADRYNSRILMVSTRSTGVGGLTVSPSSTQAGAAATWTVGFTTDATGSLSAGVDTINLTAPVGTLFPTVAGDVYVNGTAVNQVTGGGTNTLTVVTPVSVGAGAQVTVQVIGVTNPPVGSYPANDFQVSTSADGLPMGFSGPSLRFASAPGSMQLAVGPALGGAPSTWAVGLTTSSGGALTVGDAVYLAGPTGTVFPNAADDYTVNGTVTTAVYGGGGNQVEVLTPIPVGASSPLRISVGGVTNPPAGNDPASDFTVSTSTDALPVSPTGMTSLSFASEVSGVQLEASPTLGGAPSTWTLGFTTSNLGALTVGDAVYVAGPTGTVFPSATADYTIHGVVAASVYGGGSNHVEIRLPMAVAASTPVQVTIAGVTNPPAGSDPASDFGISTSRDTWTVGLPAAFTFTPPVSGGGGGASFTFTPPAGGVACVPAPGSGTGGCIGPTGGTVRSADGAVAVTVPAGALTGPVAVTVISRQGEGLPPAPVGFRMGPVWSIGAGQLSKPITVQMRYDPALLDGMSPQRLAIYTLNPATDRWVWRGGRVDPTHDTVTVSLPSPGVVAVMVNTTVFHDLQGVPWARTGIDGLLAAGVVNGVGNGQFAPEDPLTRAQFTKFLVLASGLTPATDGTTPFHDVHPGSWFAPYVAAAYRAGFVKGISGTTFAPQEPVTREEMAAMLGRLIGSAAHPGSLHAFTDASAIAHWAVNGVERTVGSGIMQGFPGSAFRPRLMATRAQAAVAIYRYLLWKNPG